MNLNEQLREDMKTALKAHDSVRLGVVRFLMSNIRNFEIDNGPQDDAGVQKVIAKLVKQSKEAITEFKSGGREDLAQEEEAKVAIMETYLPKAMSDEELKALIEQVKQQNPDVQGGQLIGLVIKAAAGQADGGRISSLMRQ